MSLWCFFKCKSVLEILIKLLLAVELVNAQKGVKKWQQRKNQFLSRYHVLYNSNQQNNFDQDNGKHIKIILISLFLFWILLLIKKKKTSIKPRSILKIFETND